MGQKEEKGSSEPKSRYVWDSKKLAWVETTEAETEEAAPEKAAIESTRKKVIEEVIVEPRAEEVSDEVPAEGVPVQDTVEAGGQLETIEEAGLVEAAAEVKMLEYRGAWIRLAGFVVDFAVMSVIAFLLTLIQHFPFWTAFVIGMIYFVGFWSWRGQTPGKMLVRAKIVKTDGSRMGFGTAFLRYLFYIVPNYAPILFYVMRVHVILGSVVVLFAFVIIALNSKKRGIHDFVAGTVVINTRPRAPQSVEADISDTAEAAEQPSTSEPEASKQD
jgi:uncharacterized RDD family membrane protein YckC